MHQLEAATAIAAATAAAALAAHRLGSGNRRSRNLPPGPPRLPIIESRPWITKTMRCWVPEQHKAYGDVFCFQSQGELHVVLGSYEAVQEAVVSHGAETSGRQGNYMTKTLHRESGLLNGDDEKWRNLRRLSLQWLRDLGFGKSAGQSNIAVEAEELCLSLRQKKGEPVDTGDLFNRAVSNVICQLVFGRRLGTEETDFERRLKEINHITQAAAPLRGIITTAMMSVSIKIFPSFIMHLSSVKKFTKSFQSLYHFCQSFIDEKRPSSGSPDDAAAEPSDFIEAFFASQAAKQHSFDDVNLQVSITDLFLAGTDTTANSLRWMALHLAQNQQLQQQLWQAVNSELGRRQPTMADRAQLPLLESFLMEVQRFYTLVPLALPHRCTEDIQVMGFDIPKGAMLHPHIRSIHSDSRYFQEPQIFKADRFIDDAGKYKASSNVIPFGVGRRSCLGETLARSEMFIFTVTLIQNFVLSLADADAGRIAEICKYTGGVVHAAGEHRIVFVDREA